MFGGGNVHEGVTEDQVREWLEAVLAPLEQWRGRRILLVIPDLTRSAPVPLLYRTLYDALHEEVACLDVLIALGTHAPLSLDRFLLRVGLSPEEWESRNCRKTSYFNHSWDDASSLRHIGDIPAADIVRITEGRFEEAVPVRVNARLFDYDQVWVIGPVFPHEVAGFSGGNKYFFPGVAGVELIHMFHWLGALITNPQINGRIRTPVRAVLDRAADLLTFPRLFFHLVVSGGRLHGLFIGDDNIAWEKAARLSAQVNIRWIERPYRLVVGVAHTRYDDIWTAGKVVYKSEPVVADGGEVIVYAPHIREVSTTHGKQIEAVGYHIRDYFTGQSERFAEVTGAIKAHSTHVRGTGTMEQGIEKPRIQVTLATSISAELCAQINLGYRDPTTLSLEDYADREDEGILLIRDAGEVLYRLVEDGL